ncbi:MAG: DUF308 domain-containing protein [Pseudomonadota bacterium]
MDAKPMVLRSWWVLALRGVLLLVFGGLALTMPGPTVLSLVAIFALYALLAGIVYLAGTVRHRRHATGPHALDWWLLLLLGLVSLVAGVLAAIVFGTILLTLPAIGALALVWLIGTYAIAAGALYLALAYRSYGRMPWSAARQVNAERRVGERRTAPAAQH